MWGISDVLWPLQRTIILSNSSSFTTPTLNLSLFLADLLSDEQARVLVEILYSNVTSHLALLRMEYIVCFFWLICLKICLIDLGNA